MPLWTHYYTPSTVAEAVDLLQRHAGQARVVAGGTDLLVEMVKQSGAENGLYGAKITGGGSGGTVAVLGRKGAGEAVKTIAEKYVEKTGREPQIFSGSSPGAAKFGFRILSVLHKNRQK